LNKWNALEMTQWLVNSSKQFRLWFSDYDECSPAHSFDRFSIEENANGEIVFGDIILESIAHHMYLSSLESSFVNLSAVDHCRLSKAVKILSH
jgi:hypothetical protein